MKTRDILLIMLSLPFLILFAILQFMTGLILVISFSIREMSLSYGIKIFKEYKDALDSIMK